MVNNRLLIAQVMHRRTQPKYNAFRYGVAYLCFNLSELQKLKLPLLGIDAKNIFSFKQTDHGVAHISNKDWIASILSHHNLQEIADGEITVITMPRMFGYVFNPVSFWLCHDAMGHLRVVVSEVNNTFREAHFYVSFHDDMRPIAPDDFMHSRKVFHVSPFMQIEGDYQYRFIVNDEKVAIWINYYVDGELVLETSLIGKRVALTTYNLIKYNLRYPMASLRVMGLIHYQAIKLFYKKIKYYRKPKPPLEEMTR
jgi:uncharacterized protein